MNAVILFHLKTEPPCTSLLSPALTWKPTTPTGRPATGVPSNAGRPSAAQDLIPKMQKGGRARGVRLAAPSLRVFCEGRVVVHIGTKNSSSRIPVNERALSSGAPGARFLRDGVDQRASRGEGPCVTQNIQTVTKVPGVARGYASVAIDLEAQNLHTTPPEYLKLFW